MSGQRITGSSPECHHRVTHSGRGWLYARVISRIHRTFEFMLLASLASIGVGVILMAWWSGLALLTAFLFAGLAELTDRSTIRSPTPAVSWPWSKAQGERVPEKPRYELDSAA